MLIRNLGTSAVIGTFSGLPEGASVTLDGASYQITYQYDGINGDGNDVALVPSSTPPGELYWDPDQQGAASEAVGAGDGDNECGTWDDDPTNLCWYDPASNADVAWTDGNEALFANVAGTVTVSAVVSPAAITFDSGGYIVNGTSGDSLSLPAGGTCIYQAAGQTTINCPITGNGTLTVTGPEGLLLGGVNTAAGGLDIQDGTLQLGSATALNRMGALTVNGGELDLAGQDVTVASLAGNGGLITSSSIAATVTDSQSADTAYLGGLSNTTLNVTGGGQVTMQQPNQPVDMAPLPNVSLSPSSLRNDRSFRVLRRFGQRNLDLRRFAQRFGGRCEFARYGRGQRQPTDSDLRDGVGRMRDGRGDL